MAAEAVDVVEDIQEKEVSEEQSLGDVSAEEYEISPLKTQHETTNRRGAPSAQSRSAIPERKEIDVSDSCMPVDIKKFLGTLTKEHLVSILPASVLQTAIENQSGTDNSYKDADRSGRKNKVDSERSAGIKRVSGTRKRRAHNDDSQTIPPRNWSGSVAGQKKASNTGKDQKRKKKRCSSKSVLQYRL